MKAILGNFTKISETEFRLKKNLQFADVSLDESHNIETVRYQDKQSIEVGDIFISSKSTSARTGLAPASNTALAVATNVRSGIITSSFFFKPSDFNAKCRADVPLETPTAYLAPVNFAKSFSNWRNFGPSVSNDELKAFVTTVLS